MIRQRCNPNFEKPVATASAPRSTASMGNALPVYGNRLHANIGWRVNVIRKGVFLSMVRVLHSLINESYGRTAYHHRSTTSYYETKSCKSVSRVSETGHAINRQVHFFENKTKTGSVENRPYPTVLTQDDSATTVRLVAS